MISVYLAKSNYADSSVVITLRKKLKEFGFQVNEFTGVTYTEQDAKLVLASHFFVVVPEKDSFSGGKVESFTLGKGLHEQCLLRMNGKLPIQIIINVDEIYKDSTGPIFYPSELVQIRNCTIRYYSNIIVKQYKAKNLIQSMVNSGFMLGDSIIKELNDMYFQFNNKNEPLQSVKPLSEVSDKLQKLEEATESNIMLLLKSNFS